MQRNLKVLLLLIIHNYYWSMLTCLKGYFTVQSMVESNTWNVKVEPTDTVGDICKRLSNKIDVKYKVLELYLIGNRKFCFVII